MKRWEYIYSGTIRIEQLISPTILYVVSHSVKNIEDYRKLAISNLVF